MLTRGIWHLVTKRWTLKRSFSMIKDVNLPSTPARINSCALGAADLQHPLKGGHSGEQKQGICALATTGRPGLQLVGYSQELILRAQVLYCLLYRKAQTFCMVTTVSRDKQKLQETSRKSLEKICAWLHDPPLHQKNHISWPCPRCLFGVSERYLQQSLTAIWGAVSWAAVVHLLPNKT